MNITKSLFKHLSSISGGNDLWTMAFWTRDWRAAAIPMLFSEVCGKLGLIACLGGFCGLATPAQARFSVCNQTLDVVNVAMGLYQRDSFVTSGWWTIGPNQCADVIERQLEARYVYVFAQDVFGRIVLSGSTPMCVAPDRFEIRGETDCLVRGYIDARFHEVDTLQTERWQLFLYPPP